MPSPHRSNDIIKHLDKAFPTPERAIEAETNLWRSVIYQIIKDKDYEWVKSRNFEYNADLAGVNADYVRYILRENDMKKKKGGKRC